jgi:hypothetical protein
MDLRETWREGVDCMHLTQDRDQWRALVNSVMNFLIPKKKKKWVISLVADWLLTFQEGLCSLVLVS